MKKTLIALAAVAAATGALAQSTVTISGRLDISAMSNNKAEVKTTSSAAAYDTKTTGTGSRNGWTTSEVRIGGTEDLGGGLRASFIVASGLQGNFADRDTNIALSGGFGTVRLGNFAPATATGFNPYTGALSTNQAGTLYGAVLSGSTEMGSNNARDGVAGRPHIGTATTVVGGNFERQTAVIQYTTPSFNGFVVNASYGKNGLDRSDRAGDGHATQTGLSFSYAAGPLAIGGGTNQRKENREDVPGAAGICINNTTGATSSISTRCDADLNGVTTRITGADPVPAQSVKAKLNWLGASYDLGVAKVNVARITRTGDTTNAAGATTRNTDITINALGVTVPMGAVTLAASMYDGKNKGATAATDDLKLSGHQLSVQYALSKRTTVYALMGENKSKLSGTNTGATNKRTSSAVGLLHTF